MAKQREAENTVCRNRKATYRFEVLERLECGLVLRGSEVKSLRDHNASIDEAYASVIDNELWLIGCHISAYTHSQAQNLEPLRRRKLLIHAREIRKLRIRIEQKGITLVPLRIYFNDRGIAKITVGLGRGKKVGDKREDMKARDHKREIDRAMQGRR